MSARPPRPKTPGTTFLLIAIFVGFAIEIATGAWKDGEKLAHLGAVHPYFIWVEHEYWRLVTAMFLHGNGTIPMDFVHLTMNCFTLYNVGTLFEINFGTRRFLWTYFISGIVASFASVLFTRGASVGASGALFGIVGAFIVTVRRSPRLRKHHVARSIVGQLIFWTVGITVIATQIPQIDMAGHIGGFLAGAILAAVLPQIEEPPPPPSTAVVDVMPYDG